MTTVETFMQGSKMIVRVTFETESVPGSMEYDTLTDPSTVTFTARRRNPDGRYEEATAYVYGIDSEAQRVSQGVFEFAHEPDPGRWTVHVQGTGNAYGAVEATYEIEESEALAA